MKTFSLFRYKPFLMVLAVAICCYCASCSTTQSIRGAALTNGNERTFNREMTIVLPALRQALTEEQMTIAYDSTVDERTHMIVSETPPNGFSWGEVIRIVAVKQSNDKTTLYIITERKMATNIFANGDYSTNLFFKIEQKLPK